MGCDQSSQQFSDFQILDEMVIFQSPLEKFQGKNEKPQKEETVEESSDEETSGLSKEFKIIFQTCNQNVDDFFHAIEKRTSKFYDHISHNLLNQLNEDKITEAQFKIKISQHIFSLNLTILRIIGKSCKFEYPQKTFERLNKFQKDLLEYMKTKYPKQQKTSTPTDLMKIFEEFDDSNYFEYDILSNSKTHFWSSDEGQIIRTIKSFINKVLFQCDNHFERFEKEMKKIFPSKNKKKQKQNIKNQPKIEENSEGKGEKNPASNKMDLIQFEEQEKTYKICRKIPQTATKYEDYYVKNLQINSPEVFRVLIKWISHLERLILNPSDRINKKSIIKIYDSQRTFAQNVVDQKKQDYIDEYESEKTFDEVKQRILQLKDKFQKKNEELIDRMDEFNMGLLKILNTQSPQQNFVSLEEIQRLKYASFNSKFVQFILTEKLIFAIKELVIIGQSFNSSFGKNLDLIKFQVSDLFRCRFSGSKSEIIEVYKKFKSSKEIKIIKIKNRLLSSLNDIMIKFMIDNCWLVCEAQLILAAQNKTQKRNKYIEMANHYFYEVGRSPYGIMAELSLLLKYKDSKIAYESKIKFSERKKLIKRCLHKKNILKQQIHPFICSDCMEFYGKNQNLFFYYACSGSCRVFICSKCIFKKDEYRFSTTYLSEIAKAFDKNTKTFNEQNKIFEEKQNENENGNRKQKGKSTIKKYYREIVLMRQKFGSKKNQGSQKVKIEKIMNQLSKHQKEYEYYKNDKINKQKGNQRDSSTKESNKYVCKHYYFVYVNFVAGQTQLNLFMWHIYKKKFYKATKMSDGTIWDLFAGEKDSDKSQIKYDEEQFFTFENYDLLLIFTPDYQETLLTYEEKQEKERQEQVKKKLQNDQPKENQEEFIKNKPSKDDKNQEKEGKRKKDKKLEDEQKLKAIKSKSIWISQYQKFIVQQNQISNQGSIFQKTIEKIRTSNTKHRVELNDLEISDKKIEKFPFDDEWKKQIKFLNISNNNISFVSAILGHLKGLQRVYFDQNQVQDLQFPSLLPNLEILSGNQNEIRKIKNFQNVPKIKKLLLMKNRLTQFISGQKLERLNTLNLNDNYLQVNSIYEILDSGFPLLQDLMLNQRKQILESKNSRNSGSNQEIWFDIYKLTLSLPKLKNFQLNLHLYVSKKSERFLPFDQFERLRFGKQNLSERRQYYFNDENDYDVDNKKNRILQLESKNLERISVVNSEINKIMIKQKDYKIKYLNLSGNKIQSLDFLSFSNKDQNNSRIRNQQTKQQIANETLVEINLSNNLISAIPIMRFPALKKLDLQGNSIENLQNFEISKLPELQYLDLSQNKFQTIVKFELPKLKQLLIKNIEVLQDTTQQLLITSNIPALEILDFSQVKRLCLSFNLNKQIYDGYELTVKAEEQIETELQQKLLHRQKSQRQKNGLVSKTFLNEEMTGSLAYPFQNLKKLIFSTSSIKNQKIADALIHMQGLECLQFKECQFSGNLPKLNLPKVTELKLINLIAKSFKNLEQSQLPNLIYLELIGLKEQESQMENTLSCAFEFPKLEKLQIYRCQFGSLNGLGENSRIHQNLTSIKIQDVQLMNDQMAPINFPRLIELQCSNLGQDSQVSEIVGENLQGLKALNLSSNNIQSIESIPFKNLSNVTQIDLSFNKISEFQISEPLPHLISLNLSNNQLTTFEVGDNLSQLNSLDLNNNQLSYFSGENNCPELTFLNLSNNQICVFQTNKSMPQLVTLNLAYNQISQFSIKQDFYQLNTLYLNLNRITRFSILKQLNQLTSIYLDYNQLHQLTISFPLPLLSTLYLRNNRLNQFTLFEKLPHLTTLDLDRNRINEISINHNNFCLTNLKIQNNQLQRFTLNSNLPLLTSILLKNNQINQFSINQDLPNLKQIDLNFNKLSEFKISYKISKLAYLNLESNRLENIQIDHDLYNLVSLNLQKNQLRQLKIGKNIKNLRNLTSLQLSNNRIQTIEIYENLPAIEQINLQKNRISKFEINYDLPGLVSLDLSQNSLKSFSIKQKLPKLSNLILFDNYGLTQFLIESDLPLLTSINLERNQLKQFSIKHDLPKLTYVNLQRNQLISFQIKHNLPELKYLNLSWNQLTKLEFENDFPNLISCIFYNNKISQFNISGKLPKLITLDLSWNELAEIPIKRSDFPQLKSVNMSYNKEEEKKVTIASASPMKIQKLRYLYSEAKDIEKMERMKLK